MTLQINKTVKNNVYISEINVSLSFTEYNLIEKYGEPDINIGGSISEGFTLPSLFKKIYTDSPLKYENIDKTKVNSWTNVIVGRLTDISSDLNDHTDDFTDEIKIQL